MEEMYVYFYVVHFDNAFVIIGFEVDENKSTAYIRLWKVSHKSHLS